MVRRVNHLKRLPAETQSALADYLAELAKICPEGAKEYQIVPWPVFW
jgi:hypothetical protein